MSVLKLWNMFIVCLLISMAHYSSESDNNNQIKLKITSQAQCNNSKINTVDIDSQAVYRVQMSLLNSSCLTKPEQYGFYCKLSFYQKDDFALVESELCVDLQGVQRTLPDTQLTLTVFNSQRKLKEVFMASQLPPGAPYYVCSGVSSSLSVSLSVRDSVQICPYIMNKLVGYNISFGSVMMRPTLPTYTVSMGNCSSAITTRDDAYVVKVTTEGYSSFCQLQNLKNHSYTNTNSCIELIFVSLDYLCNISVELFQSSRSVLRFEVPIGRSSPAIRGQLFCASYSSTGNDDQLDSILVIQKHTRTECSGNFAIRATFTETDNDVTEDTYVDNMRTLYMAVFISLISVCLLILCVTCIFCLHMRSKRRQRAQRQGLDGGPNEGFEASHTHDTSVSWNQSNTDEFHGLPTYDDICGKNSDTNANHLSTDEEPPSYDTLFSSDV